MFPRLHQLLIFLAADRNHQTAAFPQLACQYRRDFRRARRDQNRVVRRGVGKTQGTISIMDMNVRVTQVREALLRGKCEGRVVFDSNHFARQQRKHRCLIARSRADFQHTLCAGEFERFSHCGDHVRLRNGLFLPDWQRFVGIRVALKFRGNKFVARDAKHRLENAWRCNSAFANLGFDHREARIVPTLRRGSENESGQFTAKYRLVQKGQASHQPVCFRSRLRMSTVSTCML